MTPSVFSRAGRARLLPVLLVLGLLSGVGVAQAQTFDEPGFVAETVVTLQAFQPVGLTWAPDGSLFIWQKNGLVRVFRAGALQGAAFIDLTGQVNTFDDRGMTALALDPDFAQNGYVYLGYVYEPGADPNTSAPRTSRITRVTSTTTPPYTAIAGSETVLIGDIPADSGSHDLGSIRFAPDGTMYVSSGDGATAAFVDSLALGAQSLDSYRGKILRINPDGSAPHPPQLTNPFYDGTDSIRSRVWAYGVRNAYRFSIHPTLGDLYGGDVGWNNWEEINRYVAGGNYGWPCWEGAGVQPQYQAQFPATCGPLTSAQVIAPLYTYSHSIGTAAVGGPFYTASAYPAEFVNNFFFTDYTGSWIRRLVLNLDGSIAQNVQFASNVGTAVSLELGPDGMLYYPEFVSGAIRRIRYNGPLAVAAATPSSGYSPLQVSFSSAGSQDSLGGPLTYFWAFGDGATSTSPNPVHTFVSATVQSFTASLTVSSQTGATSVAPLKVTVGSLPPTPVILSPADGTEVLPGQTIQYSGAATDPDEGSLPASALRWDVLLHHNEHVHAFTGGTGATGSFVTEFHGAGTYAYELRLTATDASGLAATTTIMLPMPPDATPPGAPSGLTAIAALTGPIAVDLAWSAASDDVGVGLYHIERCAGTACTAFAEVGISTTTDWHDVSVYAATAYRYRVRAEDYSSNLGAYSGLAAATTRSLSALPGLVAAWSFDEGTNNTAGDSSGGGHTGTLNGPVWTAGRYGEALQFDGVNDTVLVADAAALDLTAGMTLEAWVRSSSTLAGWKVIMQKETDAWFLNANTGGGNHLGVGGTFAGSCCTVLDGPAALPVNQWTHVAGTYDGAMLRLYVNGVAVANVARTGNLQVTSLPLRIGGSTYAGEYFPGLIDEVRIYNRALSLAEIQQDMTTPVAPAADGDGDGIADAIDNCTAVANAGQLDADTDGYGNLCDADLDNSGGTVNFADLALFRAAFGGTDPVADFNGNGAVNFADLALFRALFGKAPGPSALLP